MDDAGDAGGESTGNKDEEMADSDSVEVNTESESGIRGIEESVAARAH